MPTVPYQQVARVARCYDSGWGLGLSGEPLERTENDLRRA